jgi:hypothetical protein
MNDGTSQNKWPTKGSQCQMPDLGNLFPRISLNYLLNRAFGGRGPADALANARIVNFIRIVDAVVADYQNLRGALTEYLTTDNGHFSPIFDAISFAEECLSNMHRAVSLAEAIRKDQKGPQIDKTKMLSTKAASDIHAFRVSIQHLDGMLAEGKWVPPSAHCLAVTDVGLELYQNRLSFTDLAQSVTRLHRLADELSKYKEP